MRCLENVSAMRIVALHAIHSLFKNRMVIGQFELRVSVEMTIETSSRLPARVDDELSASAARLDVQAAWPVT